MRTTTWSLPVGAITLLVAEIILIAVISAAVLYLAVTFLHSWIANRSFGTAVATFEENVKKVGMVLAAPFIAVGVFFVTIAAFIFSLFEKLPFKNWAEFFAWFAAADLEVWRVMPSPVRKKRTTFGLLMFMVILVTSSLAGRVWGEIFKSSHVGIVIGVLYFLVIASLDRAIISYMDHNSRNWKMVLARLVMVIGISYLNTSFIAMEIYSVAIARQIGEDKEREFKHFNDSISTVKATYETERASLVTDVSSATDNYVAWANDEQKKIDDQRTVWRNHQQQFIEEVAGRAGSHLKGWGDAAKADKVIADTDSLTLIAMMTRFDSLKHQNATYLSLESTQARLDKRDAELISEIDKLDKLAREKKAEISDRKQDGYGERTDAMWAQARKRPFSFFMVFVLFFTLEAMAVLMKVMGGKDNYDDELELRKQKHASEHQWAHQIAFQTGQNAHNGAMNNLVQTAATAQTSHAISMKSKLDLLTKSNLDLVQQIHDHLAKIDEQVSGLPNAESVKEKLVAEYFATIGIQN